MSGTLQIKAVPFAHLESEDDAMQKKPKLTFSDQDLARYITSSGRLDLDRLLSELDPKPAQAPTEDRPGFKNPKAIG